MTNDNTKNIGSASSSPLGKISTYVSHYQPQLLYAIPRSEKRSELGILESKLPFFGFDLWNGYELSWLNRKGKPMISILQAKISAQSANLIESKSFKLYLNSFNQTQFDNIEIVQKTLAEDLSRSAGAPVEVKLIEARALWGGRSELDIDRRNFGELIDDLDIEVTDYNYDPKCLSAGSDVVNETLVSHLLKSNCLITGQPDWGSIAIKYIGHKIDRKSLLKYLISFRNHNEFHEQCVERVFFDLKRYCGCQKLSVMARYTRRGGLDINPFRSDFEDGMHGFGRTIRQ